MVSPSKWQFVLMSACLMLAVGCGDGAQTAAGDEVGSTSQQLVRATATVSFESVRAKDDRAYAVLGGGGVLMSDGSARFNGIGSFDGTNMYKMVILGWTGADNNADGAPDVITLSVAWVPANFTGDTLYFPFVVPVTGGPLPLDMNGDGAVDFNLRVSLVGP